MGDLEKNSLDTGNYKRNKKKIWLIFSVIVVIAIIINSSIGWFFFFRPLSIEEIQNKSFKAGDVVKLSGTITNISTYHTNYQTFSVLILDNHELLPITVNESNYKIGDNYHTKLKFQNYYFNGNQMVSASELIHSYMALPAAIGQVMDDVSYVRGFSFNLTSNSNNTIEYRLIQNNASYPLSDFNVSLRKGGLFEINQTINNLNYPVLFAMEYVQVMGDYDKESEIDYMSSLEDGISNNNMITFIDVNSDNLISDSDIFRIHLPATQNHAIIETYELILNDKLAEGSEFPGGGKYIINWYDGAYQSYSY